jgi:CspA family cold shock protein
MAEELSHENVLIVNEQPDINDTVYIGQVKWMNNQGLGYGFITVCSEDKKGLDIFVHHTDIKPQNSTYRSLTKGEYVEFNIVKGEKGLQAVNVTGIRGGPLMCDFNNSKPQFNKNTTWFGNTKPVWEDKSSTFKKQKFSPNSYVEKLLS